jgi:hypothetical protein
LAPPVMGRCDVVPIPDRRSLAHLPLGLASQPTYRGTCPIMVPVPFSCGP